MGADLSLLFDCFFDIFVYLEFLIEGSDDSIAFSTNIDAALINCLKLGGSIFYFFDFVDASIKG